MSVQAIAWALSVKTKGDVRAKLVLLALANYADDKGRCWPSQATIAEQTEQSLDTIQDRLNELENMGFLLRAERPYQNGKKGGLYFYHLLMPGINPNLGIETMPPGAARSKTIPPDGQNHAAGDPKTMPPCSGTNHHLITTNSKEGGNLDFEGSQSGPFKALPRSPEFLAWRSYAVSVKKRFLVSLLDRREMEGRSFEFDSRWPPGWDPFENGLQASN